MQPCHVAAVEKRIDAAVSRIEVDHAWGNGLSALGREDEAVVEYETAIELEPENAEAWCNLGHTLRSLGRYRDSLINFQSPSRTAHCRLPPLPRPDCQWKTSCGLSAAEDLMTLTISSTC